MARNTATDDPRSDELKQAMAQHFEDFEFEYREDRDTHAEVIYEDDEKIVVVDHTGHEINEWANDYDVDREELSMFFHKVARDLTGYDWAVSDPVVFDKFED